MAEFSLKDTLIGGGILFGIGVFIKKVKGKKQVEDDSQDWGGDPDGQLAKALAKVREESKKPREPLKIEKLPEPSSPYYEITVESSSKDNLGRYDFDGITLETELDSGYGLSRDYGEGGDEPLMLPEDAIQDYKSQISLTTYSLEPDWDEDTEEWHGAENTNIWRGTINFPEGNLREGGEFYTRAFGFTTDSESEAEQAIMNHILNTLDVYARERADDGDFNYYYGAETFDAESKSDCPPATKDVAINTKNRNATIKNYGYGPLNVEEPADFWKDIAKQWKTTEKAAKKSKCGNCVAFDRSPRMKDCMPGETSDGEGVLGYCWMHHFKCHSARTCDTWAKGGPITTDKVSEGWGERAFPKTEMKGGGHMDFGSETFNAIEVAESFNAEETIFREIVRISSADFDDWKRFNEEHYPYSKRKIAELWKKYKRGEYDGISETFNAEDSPPIEYPQYRRRINYLEMIYNAFYDPESSIYQVVNGQSSGAISYGEGFIQPAQAIFFDLRNGSSQLDGQRLSFRYGGNRGSRYKLETNVKNALQRASGTKLSSSGRLHHGGLIGADYEYNGKMFFVRYNMRGRGSSRRTTLSVASQDSIPEYRRGDYPFSRAYEHENDYKYQGGAESFNAEQRLPNLTQKQKEAIERFAWYYHAKVNGIRNRWVNEEDYDELMDSGLTQKVGSARFLSEVSRPTIKALLNKGVIEALKTNLWNYDGRIRKSTAEQLNENPNLVSKVKWIRFTLTPLGVQVIKRMSDLNGDNPLSAESDEKREVQKYRIGDMKVREYDDGTLERYEAQRIQYDYMVHREPRGTEVDDDGNRIPNPRGGRFTSADAETFGVCPCGCNGKIEYHDDRGYGCWECARCGEDSDADMGEDCSYCVKMLDMEDNPQNYPSYQAETLGAEEVNGGYNDCCSSENITVYHWNGANYHDDDKELSYYPAECRVCGVEYDAGLSMYGNSSSIQDLEVSALGAETFDAESKLCESCNQTGNKFYGNTCSKCVYGDQEWCSNCGGMDCKKMPDGDWYCMNFLNNRETYDGRYDAETFEDCEVCYATVDKGTLNDVQAGRICNECHKMNQYEGGTKTIKTPYNAETFEAELSHADKSMRIWEMVQQNLNNPMAVVGFYATFFGEDKEYYDGMDLAVIEAVKDLSKNPQWTDEMFKEYGFDNCSWCGKEGKKTKYLPSSTLGGGSDYWCEECYEDYEGEKWDAETFEARSKANRPIKRYVWFNGLNYLKRRNANLPSYARKPIPDNWITKEEARKIIETTDKPIRTRSGRNTTQYLNRGRISRPNPIEEIKNKEALDFFDDKNRRFVGVSFDEYEDYIFLNGTYHSQMGAETFEASTGDIEMDRTLLKEQMQRFKDDPEMLEAIKNMVQTYGVGGALNNIEMLDLWLEEWEREEKDESERNYKKILRNNKGLTKQLKKDPRYRSPFKAESFSAETFLANEMPFKSFWLVAKKGSKSFPAGQVGELRVYENGERTIVLDNNLIIPFYNQDLAYAYLNEHFMVYPKKGTADKGMLMRAEGDHDDHDHDHEDIDELIEKINRVTDFAITFIHDGGFGGEPKGIVVDEELGLKTEIVNYVEGSIDLRLVRDLETNELVSVRFALTGNPDETPILYLPLPEQLTTVPEEERSVKES